MVEGKCISIPCAIFTCHVSFRIILKSRNDRSPMIHVPPFRYIYLFIYIYLYKIIYLFIYLFIYTKLQIFQKILQTNFFFFKFSLEIFSKEGKKLFMKNKCDVYKLPQTYFPSSTNERFKKKKKKRFSQGMNISNFRSSHR